MSWFLLAIAIGLETTGTVSMKLSHGFTRLVPSVMMFVLYASSFVLMTVAVRKIDINIAYAIWAGTGTALVTVIGILYFNEPTTVVRLLFILLIIIGVVGVFLSGSKS